MVISVAIFGGLHVNGDAYVPTFVCYVSIAGAVIFLYGGNIPALLTGSILGVFTSVPIALWMRYSVVLPNNFPGVIAAVTGMWLGGIITFEVCKQLPWMIKVKDRIPTTVPSASIPGVLDMNEYKHKHPVKFFFRRILCDFAEPVFVANEWAGAFLVIGSMITWLFNPLQPYYGTGWFSALILCQVLTTGLCMWLYWDQWMERDFVPTFVPLVSVAPASILTFGPTLPVVIISSIIGAFFCPPVADLINRKIPSHWHVMVGLTFSMALVTGVAIMLIRFLGMCIPGIY